MRSLGTRLLHRVPHKIVINLIVMFSRDLHKTELSMASQCTGQWAVLRWIIPCEERREKSGFYSLFAAKENLLGSDSTQKTAILGGNQMELKFSIRKF